MAENMISMKDITKTYKSMGEEGQALSGVTLDIEKGESVAVMGHSGSGKSTLLSIIGGLTPPTSGTITMDEIDFYKLYHIALNNLRRLMLYIPIPLSIILHNRKGECR